MQRPNYIQYLRDSFKISPVVALLGPRQCGKTTLARMYFQSLTGAPENYFDLEDPLDLQRLQDPKLALEALEGLIVIDEIQRAPELFPLLRVLVDQRVDQVATRQFLILGSASRELIAQSSESLAGRIHYMELTPFSYEEVGDLDRLWVRGGYPLSYLADSDAHSAQWRKDYVRTFLEQDIPNLGITIPSQNLRRFWMMLAHYHGQNLNASEIGGALDISHNTVKRYLDILTGTFMMRQLQPWFENISKRQVKSSKLYFRDSGLYHTLLNLNDRSSLLTHPKLGASWEGFALESVIRHLGVDNEDCYFWAVHNQAELDLMVVQGSQRLGFEIKHSKTPKLTRSMVTAYETLNLDKLTVIYLGEKSFPLSKGIGCVPLTRFLEG